MAIVANLRHIPYELNAVFVLRMLFTFDRHMACLTSRGQYCMDTCRRFIKFHMADETWIFLRGIGTAAKETKGDKYSRY